MSQNPVIALANKLANGTYAAGSLGAQRDQIVSQLHGAKYAQAVDNNIFVGGNQTGVTTSVALATTYVGCCLSNPAGSAKNLVLRRVNAIFSVVQAAKTAIGLITGFAAGGITAHTTPLTTRSGFIGSASASVGKLDSACTLVGTPVWSRWFSAGATATSDPQVDQEIEGGFVIPPGGYAALGTLIAGPTSGFLGSMEWEEVSTTL